MSLDSLFRPRHVAVIGASRTPGKSGHAVVKNLITCGFTGLVTPVNPAGGEVEGIACATAIADIADPIDCAMIVLPAAGVVAAVRACAAHGVKSVIVGASGFAETNTAQGRDWQAALTAIAADAGMRLLGPNTNGLFNANDRVSIGYNAAHADVRDPGPIGVISHSGALFGGVLNSLRRIGAGLGKYVPVGNEADIDMLDVLDYLIDDPDTTVIGMIIEAISDGERLRAAASRAFAAGKPIVALKVGRSQVGVGAALAHSSRLAGSARAYDALFRAAGIASVTSVEALAGGCALLARKPARAGDRRLIAVTTSGAGGALLADAAAVRDIPLAGAATGEWHGKAGEAIAALPARGWLRNPIDMGSLDTWAQLNEVYAALEEDGFDGPTAVYAHVAPSPAMDQELVAALAARAARTASPVVVIAPGGLNDTLEAAYRDVGIPLFHDSATCFDSLNCFYQLRTPAADDVLLENEAPGIAAGLAAGAGQSFLSETDSAEILRRAGVPMVPSQDVADVEAAVAAASTLGYPVVLKALVPGIAHKNDAGLVQVGIGSEAALRQAFAVLAANVARLDAPGRTILQPMLKNRGELILGVTREANLGHFLVIGVGGVHAEIFDQVTLLPVPLAPAAMREALEATILGRLLRKLDRVDAMLAAAAALQALVIRHGEAILSVDINPLLVVDDGLRAVDALVVPSA
jgi:acyl-CoA synthetase (NDP forming)